MNDNQHFSDCCQYGSTNGSNTSSHLILESACSYQLFFVRLQKKRSFVRNRNRISIFQLIFQSKRVSTNQKHSKLFNRFILQTAIGIVALEHLIWAKNTSNNHSLIDSIPLVAKITRSSHARIHNFLNSELKWN